MKGTEIGGREVRPEIKVAGNQGPTDVRVWGVEEEEEATPVVSFSSLH